MQLLRMKNEKSSTSETVGSIAHFLKHEEWKPGQGYPSERLWNYFGETMVWRVFRTLQNCERKVECECDSDLRDDYKLTLKFDSDNGNRLEISHAGTFAFTPDEITFMNITSGN